MEIPTGNLIRVVPIIAALLVCAACSTPASEPAQPVDSDGDGIRDSLDVCANTPSGAGVTREGCPEDTDGDGVPDHIDACPDTPPGAAACNFGCEAEAPIVCTPVAPIVINLVNDEFEFDSSVLTADMMAVLDTLIEEFKNAADLKELTVVGHTDSVGTEAYNQALSQRRAQSVVTYLQASGLSSIEFQMQGAGETQPIEDNATDAGRAANRRVELFTRSVDSGKTSCVSQQEAALFTKSNACVASREDVAPDGLLRAGQLNRGLDHTGWKS